MSTEYYFVGRDRHGSRVSGAISAHSQRSALELLGAQGNTVEKISDHPIRTWKWPSLRDLMPKALNSKALEAISFQLGSILEAGIPIEKALELLIDKSDKETAQLCRDLRASILEGDTFSRALKRKEGMFSNHFVTAVQAGETNGAIAQVLLDQAEYLNRRIAFNSKITSALIYPCILIVAAVAVVLLLMNTVVPGFIEIFDSTGQALPSSTRGLLAFSGFIQSSWHLVLGGLVALGLGFSVLMRDKQYRQRLDRWMLKLPLIGTLQVQSAALTVCGLNAMLLASGVQLSDALKISIGAVSNADLKDHYQRILNDIEQGASLSAALGRASHVPDILAQLTASGELSGDLAGMLSRAETLIQKDVDDRLLFISTALEPTILLLVASFIFFIVISLMEPLLQLNMAI